MLPRRRGRNDGFARLGDHLEGDELELLDTHPHDEWEKLVEDGRLEFRRALGSQLLQAAGLPG